MMDRRLVFICSPFSGGKASQKENVRYAREATAFALDSGVYPFTPHLFYPTFLDDGCSPQRVIGMSAGMGWLRRADMLWVFYDNGVSAGMREEIAFASNHGVPIRFVSLNNIEVQP